LTKKYNTSINDERNGEAAPARWASNSLLIKKTVNHNAAETGPTARRERLTPTHALAQAPEQAAEIEIPEMRQFARAVAALCRLK
jgi:hypothetical protein